jgi:hypothetical protein
MDNIQGRNYAVNILEQCLHYNLVIPIKRYRLQWSGSVISVPSKRIAKISRRKKINSPSRTLATKLVFRLELLLATSSDQTMAPARSDARFDNWVKSSPTASLGNKPPK